MKDEILKDQDKLSNVDQHLLNSFENIVHEIKNPLFVIASIAQQLISGSHQTNPVPIYKDIHYNAQNLIRLVNQVLDLLRLETGQLKLQSSEANFITFVKRQVNIFTNFVGQKNIRINLNINTEEVLYLYFDPDKLSKVFFNLLVNAIKYTPENNDIYIQADLENYKSKNFPISSRTDSFNSVKITIKNTGSGIPPELQSRIFERHFSLNNSSDSGISSTGIGLAYVKELIELHYGEILVKSVPGEFTEFIFYLPLGKKHLDSSEISTSGNFSIQEEAPSLQNPFEKNSSTDLPESLSLLSDLGKSSNDKTDTVLIVEDNANHRENLKNYLENNYIILEASNGKAGFALAQKHLPDLIISDVEMPEKNGYELCKLLKTEALTSHIPIILLTAYDSQARKIKSLETGADAYLTKPFSPRELKAIVHNLTKLRRQLRKSLKDHFDFDNNKIKLNPTDRAFLIKIRDIIESTFSLNNDSPEVKLSVEELAQKMGTNRNNLNKKLKSLTGHKTSEFMYAYRVQRGAELLDENADSISNIAYILGFNDVSHFSRHFKKYFDKTPSQYLKNRKKNP